MRGWWSRVHPPGMFTLLEALTVRLIGLSLLSGSLGFGMTLPASATGTMNQRGTNPPVVSSRAKLDTNQSRELVAKMFVRGASLKTIGGVLPRDPPVRYRTSSGGRVLSKRSVSHSFAPLNWDWLRVLSTWDISGQTCRPLGLLARSS
jgi:hypothetical protein